MVQAFYGRIASYEAGLSLADRGLEVAILRNVYGTSNPLPANVSALTEYIRFQEVYLGDVDIEDIKSGAFDFAALG